MEVAGLAIGIVGLAGLFTTCQSIVNTFSSYQNFDAESRSLEAEFNAYKAKFEHWGQASGISNVTEIDDDSSAELPDHGGGRDHAPRSTLENPQTQGALADVLQAIIDELISLMPLAAPTHVTRNQISNKAADSKRARLGWAVSKKKARTENIARFRRLVEALYSLVPLTGPSRNASSAEDGSALVQDLRCLLQEMRKERHAMMARDVHTWLVGSGIPNERYQESTRKRLEGTCFWILEDDTFHDWRSPDAAATGPKIMWIHGPAGFGKTILCARIVEELVQSSDKPVAHIFYSSGLEGYDGPFVAARSWISQIAAQNESALDFVRQKQLLDVNPTAGQTTIMDLFYQTIRLIPGCTLIADGLDECAHLDGDEASVSNFLRWLLESVTDTETRLLFVSRDEPAIRSELEDGPALLELRISPSHVRTDTVALSRDLVDQKLPNKNEAVRSEISTMLSDQCRGQFLWLKLQADRLRGGMSERKLQKTIETTPPGLDQAYDRIWQRIVGNEDDRARIFRILRWIALSRRPLTMEELSEAILIDDETGVILTEDYSNEITEDFVNTEIVGLCGMFIEVTGQTSEYIPADWTLQLSHFTVRQFLLNKLPTQHPKSAASLQELEAIHHTQLASACLHALTSAEYTLTPGGQSVTPFWIYSLFEWPKHFQLGLEASERLFDLASKFFAPECPAWQMLGRHYDLENLQPIGCSQGWRPLQFALDNRLETLVVFLFKSQRFNVDEEGPEGFRPIHMACLRGLEAVIDTLIKLGADTSALTDEGESLLQFAAASGNLRVVERTLVQLGPDINQQSSTGRTPLSEACLEGNEPIVRYLLLKGAKVNASSIDGQSPLEAASRSGRVGVVRQLLEAGADVEQTSPDGLTPLEIACNWGHTDIVRVLLDHGAQVSRITGEGTTNLHYASQLGDAQLVELLLDRGAQMNSVDENNMTPLENACFEGHSEVVSLLLARSTGFNSLLVSRDDNKVLENAVVGGNINVLRLLLSNGFIVQEWSEHRWTPLHEAVDRGNPDMVELLLQKSPRSIISLRDSNDSTPLHLATHNGNHEIAKLLIDYEAKADKPITDTIEDRLLDMEDGWGRSALRYSIMTGDNSTLRILLHNGCVLPFDDYWLFEEILSIACEYNDSELLHLALKRIQATISPSSDMFLQKAAPAPHGHHLFHMACSWGSTELLDILLQQQVLTEQEFSESVSLQLSIAIRRGHEAIVQKLLLQPNIKPDVGTVSGRRPLYFASMEGRVDIVKALMATGQVHVDAATDSGSTAVWIAFRNGHHEVAQLLLPASKVSADSRDHLGRTLLWWARRRGSSELIELLSQHDVRFNSLSELEDQVEVAKCPIDLSEYWCQACDMVDPEPPYVICHSCEYVLCNSCKTMGLWCPDITHQLPSNSVEDTKHDIDTVRLVNVGSDDHMGFVEGGRIEEDAGPEEDAGSEESDNDSLQVHIGREEGTTSCTKAKGGIEAERLVGFEYYILLENLV